MGLSGFLYLAIVVGWAVYLVPFALKRYDEATRNRSIDRFSSAMRVLGRHDGADVPPSGSADANTSVAPPEVDRGAAAPPVAGREARRTAARVAARRRRRVLLALLLATAATTVAAVLAVLPSWSPALPGTLLVLWLVVCRSQARREHAARPAYAGERPARTTHTQDTVTVAEAGPTADGMLEAEAEAEDVRADAEADVVDVAVTEMPPDDEPTVVLSRQDLAEGDEYAGSGSLWDPVPVTLPTYVHKPRAPRTIRTIDLGADGVQSSARSEESAIYTHRTHMVEQNDREHAEDTDTQSPERSGPTRRAVGQ